MRYFEFLAIGDVHLEAHSRYSLLPNFIDPIKSIMRQIVDYAKNCGVSTIFQLGDVFHTPYPLKTTQIEWLKMLDPSIDWHIICGNHDYVYNDELQTEDLGDANAYTILKFYESMKALPYIHIYTSREYKKVGGIPFNFLPFPYTKPEKKYQDKITGKQSIKLGHFEVSGYKMDNGFDIKSDTKCDGLTILGHIHTSQFPVYPGSIIQSNFGEDPKKCFYHCSATLKNGKIKLERKVVPIKLPFQLITIKVSKEEDLKLLDKYKDTLTQKYILKLIVDKSFTLPANLKQKYSNIETIVGCSSKAQADALEKGVLLDSSVDTNLLDEKQLLKQNLKNQGLSKSQIKEAIKIVKKIKPFSIVE